MRLAILCGGKTQLYTEDPLEYISNSLEDVSNVLNNNDWKVLPHFTAKTEQNFSDTIKNYILEESIGSIKEILFYYSGHGIYGDSYSQSDFRMVWQDHKQPVSSVISSLNEIFDSINNKIKLSLVIDSCYSGDAITTRQQDKCIEILTSTNDGKQTYEKVIDGRGRSIFSYCFCQAFQTPSLKNEINLRDIKSFISNPENILECNMLPYYSESLESDFMVIGYTQEINKLYDSIRNHYSENVENFKKDMFSYLYNSPITLEKIHKSKTFNSLFNLLTEEKECLYCLLKQINPKNTYLSQLIEKDCDKLRIKVDKSLRSKRLIFLIGLDSTDGKGKKIYSVASYIYTNRKTLRPISHVQVDFTEQINYEKHICMIIEKSKSMMPFDSSNELIFILPEVLHTIDFKKVVCENHKTIYDYSDITIQSYTRYMHLDDKEEYIIKWNKNSDKYYKNIKNKLTNHIYPIEVILEDMRFGKNFSREGESYVCVISSDYILDRIDDILNHGIPLVICPQYKEQRCETTISICDDVEIEGSKRELFKYVDNVHDQYGSQYYMHDLYKDAKEIKKLVDESLVDENKNETEYLS